MKLLLVASDRMEFSGVVARASEVRRVECGVDWARAVKFGGHGALLVANGVGVKRAAEAVDTALTSFTPEALASVGFCGALEETLQVGDVISADCVRGRTGAFACPGAHSAPALRAWTGESACPTKTVVTVDYVVQTAAEKCKLRATGACAVEMEAAGVAARAEVLRLPFYCIKVVTDLANEDMANDFNAALRSDGHFDTMSILVRALRHPAARLPELTRMRNRCAHAARVLGDFIVESRF